MKLSAIVIAVGSVLASLAAAAADGDSDLSVKGYGTLAAVHSDSSGADFVNTPAFQPNGAGRTNPWSFSVDSKFAVQLDWKASSRLSFTAAAMSKQYEDGSWDPKISLAFAKIAVGSTLDVRLGRLRPPIYLLSDYYDVNYANPWVRPPVEFYSTAPLFKMDGADVLWRPTIGDVTMLVQPYTGYVKLTGANNHGEFAVDDTRGFNLTASRGDLTLRAGYIASRVVSHSYGFDAQVAPALGAICGLGDPAACTELGQLSPAHGALGRFGSLGANYDDGDYFVLSEFGKIYNSDSAGMAATWYLSAGKHFGKWEPYATYSAFQGQSPRQFNGGSFPGSAAYGLPSTNALVTAVLEANPGDQHTITLGVRYDVMTNLAVKAQWDRVRTSVSAGQDGTGIGIFGSPSTAFANSSNSVNLLSVALDFVF